MLLLLLATISLVAAEAASEGAAEATQQGCDEVYRPNTTSNYTREADSSGKYPIGTQVMVSCPKETVLRGNPQGTCTGNGWEPSPGLCLSACYNRDLITELKFDYVFNDDKNGWTKNGASVNAVCSHSKHRAPKGQIRTCRNGIWHPPSKCSPNLDSSTSMPGCDEVYKPETNVTYNEEKGSDGKYPHGTQVTVSCPENSVLRGNEKSTCEVTMWVPHPGLCLRVCYNGDLMKEGIYDSLLMADNYGWTENGGSVTAICRHPPKGQTLAADVRNCNNGHWTPSKICQRKA